MSLRLLIVYKLKQSIDRKSLRNLHLLGRVEMGNEKQVGLEEQFKSDLDNVVLIAESLKPHCSDVGDLIEMIKLAQSNDGQSRLLLNLCMNKGKR